MRKKILLWAMLSMSVATATAPLYAQTSAEADAHRQAIAAMYPVMLQALKDNNYDQARSICQQAISWEPRNTVHHYNLGCIEARAGVPTAALAALTQATTLGYSDVNSLRTDTDLISLQRDTRFATVLQAAARNAGTTPAPAATIRQVGARSATAAAPASSSSVVQPIVGKMTGKRPLGLFFMTRYWIATRSLEKSAYYFTADGRVYVDPTGFSAAELAVQKRGSFGTFQVSGNTLTVAWSDGQKSSNTVEDAKADAFSWDTGLFVAAHPFRTAQQLVGTFEGGNSVTTSAGSIAASGTYTFRADGTYARAGVASASSVSDGSVVNTGGQGQTAGRWQLKGFILTLTDNQGRQTSGVSFPFNISGTEARPDRMFFNGTMYKRQ